MIDVRGVQPTRYATLDLPAAETLQCFDVLPNGDIIASQGVGRAGTDKESTVFSLHRGGKRLGVMDCVDAGHGTMFGYVDGRLIFDWAGQLVSAPFKAGRYTRAKIAKPVASKLQPGFTSVSSIGTDGRVAFRQKVGDRQTWIDRDWKDAKANRDRVYGAISLPTSDPLMQGGTIAGGFLYYLSGHRTVGQTLWVYRMKDRHLAYRMPIPYGEPEGIIVEAGKLLIGFSDGRDHKILSFDPTKPTPPPARVVYVSKLRLGQTDSDSVRLVQAALNRALHLQIPVDGAYGPATAAAMEKYQRQLGDVGPYGEPGPLQTARLLQDAGMKITTKEKP